MPTYEYGCAACGHEWEEVQRITEPPLEVCPKCAGTSAHRLISGGTHFILKGGGWYSDLYSSPSAKKKASEDGEASKKPEESAAKTKTETSATGAASTSTGTSDSSSSSGSSSNAASSPSSGSTASA